MTLDLSQRPETPEQTITRLQLRIRELEDENTRLRWQSSPDRQGGHTPPNEIRGSWDQWGH
jgi:hypothetical protein